MFGHRRRSPLLWRLLKTAAAGGAVYLMLREPDQAARKARRAEAGRADLKRNAERALALKMRQPKPLAARIAHRERGHALDAQPRHRALRSA